MYEAFYGLKEKPFSMLPDPGFLYLSKKHQAALTLLEYGLLNHVGFCVVSGEPGAGKTTILRALLERIGDDVTVGLITNTHQSFGGLLDWILSAFDLHQPNLTHVEMHQIFMDYLIEEYANNRTVLLIVDEAQNMNADALEELRMLSNVNSEKDQLMQVVLAGQPALKETLRQPELMQFAQRIAVDYHLDPLSLEETCGYIQHRLVTAGAQKDIFTPAACARIHNYSGGTPRLINLLCETVLVYGFADQQKLIDVDLVEEMVQERMKDSVVPLINRDVTLEENKAVSEQLEQNFPWIQVNGDTESLQPSVDAGEDEAGSEGISGVDKQQTIAEQAKPDVVSADGTDVDSKSGVTEDKVMHADTGQVHASENKEEAEALKQEPLQKKSNKPAAPSPSDRGRSAAQTFVAAEENIFSSREKPDGKEARKQLIKYGAIAGVLALLLIVLALLLNDDSGATKVVNNEALELQKQQREQEEARLKQLQIEAAKLKKERDAALEKAEEEKRAKEEAEKLAAEKAALAIKAAEKKRALEEQQRIANAKQKERLAKQAEAKAQARAKAEAAQAKLEAARLEEERRVMQARLAEEVRLKELEEARRLELELQEKQRLEALKASELAQQQSEVEEASKVKKNLVECSGPTARFKSGCR